LYGINRFPVWQLVWNLHVEMPMDWCCKNYKNLSIIKIVLTFCVIKCYYYTLICHSKVIIKHTI
jgi:hypothetical protein